MKRLFIGLIILLAAPTLAGPVLPVPGSPDGFPDLGYRATISSFFFNSDNEGWQMTYVGRPAGGTYELLFTNSAADWSASLGDPVGSVYQTVTEDRDQRAYWLGYIGEHGFMGDLNGLILQCNVYSSGDWTTISGQNGGAGDDDGRVYARWVVSRESDTGGTYAMYISTRSVSLDMNGFTGWETFAVNVDAGNFIRWPNSPDPGPSFLDVMSDYDQIGLYLFSGTDDIADMNGGGTTWFNDGGISRLQHFGAGALSGEATWAVDNVTVDSGVVAIEAVTLEGLKAFFR